MRIDYWRLFLLALGILGVLVVWRWATDAGEAFVGLFPSSHSPARYNVAASIMLGIGVWGLLRLIRNSRGQG